MRGGTVEGRGVVSGEVGSGAGDVAMGGGVVAPLETGCWLVVGGDRSLRSNVFVEVEGRRLGPEGREEVG